MPSEAFVCKQCGNCCLNLGDAIQFPVLQADVDLWKENLRYDIFAWVSVTELGNGQRFYDAWINPVTHEPVDRCPWLRKLPNQDKYTCGIHGLKPSHCRNYPQSRIHAGKTGCKAYDDA